MTPDEENGYDIANPPTAAEWLAMDEGERIHHVRTAHEQTQSPVGQSPEVHAAIHVIVESRLAEGHKAVVDAYDRCRAAGLDRHNAIHALASVATKHMMDVLASKQSFDHDADRDYENLDPLRFKPKGPPKWPAGLASARRKRR